MIKINLSSIKMDPYKFAQTLVASREDPDYMKTVLTYGPKMCQFMDPYTCYDIARKGNEFDVLDSMFINRYIDYWYSEYLLNQIDPLEYRNKIGEVLREICSDCDENVPMEKANCIKNIYDKIDNFSKTKNTNESVLTGSSPIVPYQGVVRNQFVMQNASEDLIKDVENHNDDPNYFMQFSKEKTEEYLRQYASSRSGSMHDSINPNESFADFTKMLNRQKSEFSSFKGAPVYQPYYLMCYKYGCHDETMLESYVKMYQDNEVFSMNHEELIGMMEALTYNEKPSMDTIMNASKVMDDNIYKILDDMNTNDDQLQNYPIDKLRNFINTSRRYISSKYLSSMFLSQNKTIDHYIMEIDGIPIAEVKNKYLVAPVLDYALYNKPALISMDRDGNIEVNDATLDLSPIS